MRRSSASLRFSATLAALLAGSFALACAPDWTIGDPNDDPAAGEDVGATVSPITIQDEFNWTQYLGHPVPIVSASTHVCFLTRITGAFYGNRETVNLTVNASDNFWYLNGDSGQSGVAASVRCEPWSDFLPGPALSLSGEFEGSAHSYSDIFTSGHVQLPATLSDYRSFCWLTGFQGALNGGGERAIVDPGYGTWMMNVDNHTGSADRASFGFATCANLGQNGAVQFVGGSYASLGEYAWQQTVQGPLGFPQAMPYVQMAKISDATCFMTGIIGKFAGPGEMVEVIQSGGYWWLGGHSGQVDVGARARCVALKQRTPGDLRDVGFEQQTSGSVSLPWRTEGPGAKGIDRGAGLAHAGANNAWIRTTTGWNAISQDFDVTPGSNNQVTAWARTFNSAGTAVLGVRDPSGKILAQMSFGATRFCIVNKTTLMKCPTDYLQETLNFNAGANDHVNVFVGYSAPGADSYLQLDDVATHQL